MKTILYLKIIDITASFLRFLNLFHYKTKPENWNKIWAWNVNFSKVDLWALKYKTLLLNSRDWKRKSKYALNAKDLKASSKLIENLIRERIIAYQPLFIQRWGTRRVYLMLNYTFLLLGKFYKVPFTSNTMNGNFIKVKRNFDALGMGKRRLTMRILQDSISTF